MRTHKTPRNLFFCRAPINFMLGSVPTTHVNVPRCHPPVMGMLKFSAQGFGFQGLPVGSYPTPVVGYLLFYITDLISEIRYPKRRQGIRLQVGFSTEVKIRSQRIQTPGPKIRIPRMLQFTGSHTSKTKTQRPKGPAVMGPKCPLHNRTLNPKTATPTNTSQKATVIFLPGYLEGYYNRVPEKNPQT